MTDQSHVHAQPPEDGAFERYLAGDGSPTERETVEWWIAANRADAAAVAAVRADAVRYFADRPTPNSAAALALLLDRLGLAESLTDGVAPTPLLVPARAARSHFKPPLPALWRRWAPLSAAAVMVGAAVIAAIVILAPRGAPVETAAGRTYVTTIGQRANITLGDGTRVTLAPASTLHLDARFGGVTRTVTLVGEAYFDVSHTTGAPFTVRTGNVTTRVLGTGFDVSRYAGDRETRVAVARGKVEVIADTKHAVTLAGGAVAFANDSAIVRTERGDTARYSEWRNGQLVFRDTPASDAVVTIGRWYGVDVRLSDDLLRAKRINGTIGYASVSDVVLELEILLNAKATYESSPGARPVVIFRARSTEHDAERRLHPKFRTQPTEVGR